MPPDEEKRQEELLLLLLALASEAERRINQAVRPRLVEVMRRLRRLVQTMSPTGQFRLYEWTQIAPKALPLLEEITRTLRPNLLREVQAVRPSIQDAAYDFSQPFETRPQPLIPRTQQELLDTLNVAGAGSLAMLMGYTRLNRYTLQMAKELDILVRGMILAEATTQEISDKVLKVTTANGKLVGKVNTGSFANKMWTRVKNTSAAVVWDGVAKTLDETWADTAATEWVWNAVLDPALCPVCQPLAGQRRAERGQFNRLPPLHPNCRCAVLPLFG